MEGGKTGKLRGWGSTLPGDIFLLKKLFYQLLSIAVNSYCLAVAVYDINLEFTHFTLNHLECFLLLPFLLKETKGNIWKETFSYARNLRPLKLG